MFTKLPLTTLALLTLFHHASAITAGPDAFGYSVTDSNESEGPAFAFVDISQTGAQVVFPLVGPSFQADDIAATISLEYPFPFYGVVSPQLRVSSNGYLSTDLSDPGDDYLNDSNVPLAPTRGGGARIYPCHDDLVLDNFGNFNDPNTLSYPVPEGDSSANNLGRVFVESFPNLPSHPFKPNTPVNIIQWDNVLQIVGGITGKFTFQALLFEDGEIYISFPGTPGDPSENLQARRMTIGIQNADASVGLLYAGNQVNSVVPPQAIAFTLEGTVNPPISSGLEITSCEVIDAATGEFSLTFASSINQGYVIEASPTLPFTSPQLIDIPASEVTSTATTRVVNVNPGTAFLRVREVVPQ